MVWFEKFLKLLLVSKKSPMCIILSRQEELYYEEKPEFINIVKLSLS